MGEGPLLRSFYVNFAAPGIGFAAWVNHLREGVAVHDTLEGFACEFSLRAVGVGRGLAPEPSR